MIFPVQTKSLDTGIVPNAEQYFKMSQVMKIFRFYRGRSQIYTSDNEVATHQLSFSRCNMYIARSVTFPVAGATLMFGSNVFRLMIDDATPPRSRTMLQQHRLHAPARIFMYSFTRREVFSL